MKKLALATLVAMGMSATAIAQQPQSGQQPSQRAAQPPTQQPRETPSQREAAPAPRGGDRTEQVTFERADENGDGRVSREEANDIDGFDFSRADTNNDASLSRQEYQAAMATSTPRGDGAAGSARSGDAAGSSRSTRPGAGSQSGQGSTQRAAQANFDTVDKNKDGKVSREEANDVPGLNFSTADANDDASLSRQEFQTAMAGAQPRG
jgi:hypothetical protein